MNKKDLTVITALCNIAAANADGFTVDANSLQPITSGFSVAVAGTQNSFDLNGLINVYKYAKDHKEINAFGGWYNSENGRYYYDAVIICDDKNKALELAKVNDQIAIFDLNSLQEIRIK